MKISRIISTIARKNILITVILIGILSCLGLLIIYAVSEQKMNQQTKIVNESIAKDVEYKLLNISRLSTQVFLDKDFQEAALNLNEIDNFKYYEVITKRFSDAILFGSLINDIAYFPFSDSDTIDFETGLFEQSSYAIIQKNFNNLAEQAANKDNHKGNLVYSKLYYDEETESRYIALSRVVLKAHGSNILKPIGFGIVIINLDQLFDSIKMLTFSNADIGIINKESMMVYSGSLAASTNNNVYDNESKTNVVKPITFFDWYIVSAYDANTVFMLMRPTLMIYLFTITFITVLIVAIFYAISYLNAKDYYQLISTFSDIGAGNLDKKMEYSTNKEINKVVDYFNSMMDSINTLNKEIVDSKISSLILELENERYLINSLNSEINKHFLFNTFGLIRAMINLEKTKDAIVCVDSLCDLMRNSLSSEDMVTIKQEIKNLKSYLKIQKYRKPNIKVHIQIPDELSDFKIPKFILQPLVENSYKHGFLDNFGEIFITVEKENNQIVIIVKDNGCGATAEKITEINESLKNNSDEYRQLKSGIALINIKRRISTLMKENSGIMVSSNFGENFENKITISE